MNGVEGGRGRLTVDGGLGVKEDRWQWAVETERGRVTG